MTPVSPQNTALDQLPPKAAGHVTPANRLLRESPGTGLDLDRIAGRFVEVTGGPDTAALTVAMRLVRAAQEAGALCAWIGSARSSFFPPDAEAHGVDLGALAVIRVPECGHAARVADRLLRCGGFGLVLLELNDRSDLPLPVQSQLVGLAQQHHTALVCLTRATRRHTPRLPLVSLRLETAKARSGHDAFAVSAQAVKDKRQSPGWLHEECCRGPGGLC